MLANIALIRTPLHPFASAAGELDFSDLKDRDAVIDLFMLAHRYGFDALLDSM